MGQLYLALTDGTTTITIADGAGGATSYRLRWESWAPAIAGLRSSLLGGRGPYAEAVETLELNIHGTSAADAYSKLQTLSMLFDQAERHSRGENVAAVVVKYSPDGATVSSSASPLQARVLGRAGESAPVTLAPEFLDLTGQYIIRDVRVRFVRLGWWLHTEQSNQATAVDNGEVGSVAITGGAVDVDSPTRVESFLLASGSGGTVRSSFLLVADRAGDIILINAESMTATGFTSVADGAAFARNTNVLRYTSADTTEQKSGEAAITFNASARWAAVFANIRNNSGSTTFKIRARFKVATNRVEGAVSTPVQVIPVSFGPEWVFLGIVSFNIVAQRVELFVQASAASGTLDVDTLAILDLSMNRAQAVAFNPVEQQGPSVGLKIDHRLLTNITPLVQDNAGIFPIPYKGDVIFPTRGATLYACYLATGFSALNRWRIETSGVLETTTFTFRRRNAYLSPV